MIVPNYFPKKNNFFPKNFIVFVKYSIFPNYFPKKINHFPKQLYFLGNSILLIFDVIAIKKSLTQKLSRLFISSTRVYFNEFPILYP